MTARQAKHYRIWITAGLLGGLAVLIGAYGAHALKLQPPHADWFATANRYHFYHALALLVLPLLPLGQRWLRVIAFAWVTGIGLFSGSLYLAAAGVVQWFWLTPLGGVAMLAGWALLVVGFILNPLKHQQG